MTPETYIGDGLYASFDGFQIKLRAPRERGDHEVYLEPPVWQALLALVCEWSAEGWYTDHVAAQASRQKEEESRAHARAREGEGQE